MTIKKNTLYVSGCETVLNISFSLFCCLIFPVLQSVAPQHAAFLNGGFKSAENSDCAMYIQCYIQVHSCNDHCCRKTKVLNKESVSLYTCHSYPACKSHIFCITVYYHLWLVWLYHIFPHHLKNVTIFRKNLLNIKCVFWFSLQLLSENFSF
jgi:hypothetical protein